MRQDTVLRGKKKEEPEEKEEKKEHGRGVADRK
jgi:hypothetical protein